MTIHGSPTDYLREMLVLANEMFNSPFVFAWVLPVLVRLQPRQGENFFSSVTVTYFCFFHVDDVEASSKEMKGVGKGKPGREHLSQSRETSELPAHGAKSAEDRQHCRVFPASGEKTTKMR